MNKTNIAIATLIGTIIGAGILGIPYVIAKAGLLAGIIDIIGIGILFTILNLYMGEITLRTKGNHQLTGYAEKYLGKKGKLILTISMIIEIYGALIAYTMGEGTSLASLFGGNALLYSTLFFIIASFLIFKGLKTVGKTEFILVTGLVITIIIVSFVSTPHISQTNYSMGKGNVFIPLGIILFSFLGITSIPILKEQLTKKRKEIKKAIIIGSLVPILIYLVFALVVVGIIGIKGFESLSIDERIASAALNIFVKGPIGIFVNIFAIIAMGTSFLALGIALKKMYEYDYNFKRTQAWLLTITIPLLIFLWDAFISDITNFIEILSFTGALSAGITYILVIMMFNKAKKIGKRKPEFEIKSYKLFNYMLVILLILAVSYEVYYFIV